MIVSNVIKHETKHTEATFDLSRAISGVGSHEIPSNPVRIVKNAVLTLMASLSTKLYKSSWSDWGILVAHL